MLEVSCQGSALDKLDTNNNSLSFAPFPTSLLLPP
jgi:hypothetical protein